jgi:N-ethylmaleimide reductase
MSASLLFQPLRIGALHLNNRIVMAPLTRSRAVGEGLPTELHVAYYAQRAGAGLIIAEATQISPEGQGYLRTPGIYSDAQISAWRRVTDAVHQAGSAIVLQLWHVGRAAHPANRLISDPPVGPSDIPAPGTIYTPSGLVPFPTPRALKELECLRIAGDYARAARNALQAGFDGIEVHAANGYLIDSFLHDHTNRRTDPYGGSVENRTRLLVEIAKAVGDAIGPDRVGVRLSPFGSFNGVQDSDPASLFDHAVRGLDALDLAYLHIINPEVSGDRSVTGPGADPKMQDVPGFVRARFSGRLIVAGGYDKNSAEQALASQLADLVAFGRAFIANPDLPRRLALDVPLNEADRRTFYTSGPEGYVDYPTLKGCC